MPDNIYCTNGRVGVGPLTNIDSAAIVPLGTIVQGQDRTIGDTGEYVYARAGEAITDGQICCIDLTNKVTKASTTQANSGKPVGWALGTMADGDYGWFKISGKVKAKAGTVVADAKVMLTATAGTVDDAAVNGSQVIGAEFATADGTPAAGFAYIHANRPSIQTQIT